MLHRLWQTWRRSGREKDRPGSYIFMPRPDPVQQAVLSQWGLTVLTGETEEPHAALLAFLEELKARVEGVAEAG